jgi:hypothetical protein
LGLSAPDLAKSVPRLHGAVTAQRAIPTYFGFRVKGSGKKLEVVFPHAECYEWPTMKALHSPMPL